MDVIQLFFVFYLLVGLAWLARLVFLLRRRNWHAAAFLAFAMVWSLNALFALSEFKSSTATRDGVVRNPMVEVVFGTGLLLLPFIAWRAKAAIAMAYGAMSLLCLWWAYRFVVDGLGYVGDDTLPLALILAGHVALTLVVYRPLARSWARKRRAALRATFE